MFGLFYFFFSYNKSYAMLYISDDAFLAIAATIQSVMNGSSNLIFGFLFDKYGFKVGSQFAGGQRNHYMSIFLQNTFFVQSMCSATLSFLFVNLILFDGNEVGAKAFFLLVSSAIYAILPGLQMF